MDSGLPLSTRTTNANALLELNQLNIALNAHAIVAVTDAQGVIVQVNDKFCEISQYTRGELIGGTHRIISSGIHSPSFFSNLWSTIASGHIWCGEICNRAKDGSLYWVQTTITPFLDANGQPERYIAIRANITARKQAEEKALYLALHDMLTGLPNRILLIERLQHSLAAIRQGNCQSALLFLDLDNFKDVNDRLGHSRGDELLRQVARRLQACVCKSDTVARLGGDEFVVLLNHLQPHDVAALAHNVAEKMLETLSATYLLDDGTQVHCTTSIGLLTFGAGSQDPEELMQQADMALYEAKAQGRNNICAFTPLLQTKALNRAGLIDDLHQALERNEFRLVYQPVVNPQRQVQSWEALVRWQHPRRGLMAPGAFIDIAEQSGMILALGQWVLQTACEQLARWSCSSATAHWSIAVNISIRQLQETDFAAQVQEVVARTGADPRLLRLELTESMLLTDIENCILKMRRLQSQGVRFALDDFGTGYSSLAYLKRLPLDQLKIDRSFIQDLPDNPEGVAIAKTILALARALDLQVVAEGVESEVQFDFLLQHGCQAFQGYLFGKPMPVQEAEQRFIPIAS